MKSKKELRDSQKQKEKSSAKVSQFLLNLQTLKKQLEQDRASVISNKKIQATTPRTPRKAKRLNTESEIFITAPSSVERLSPLSRERGCFGHGDPSIVDEAGHPLVSIKEAAAIVQDFRGTLTQTSIQRGMLSDQGWKLKDQQKEIEEMEQIKHQLQMGRAITNIDLYRCLIFKENGQRKIKSQPSGISHKRQIHKNDIIEMKFKEEQVKTDFSNLRGQAPVVTRKKEIRNIIVPQEEIVKANREFLGHSGDQYDSDNSEPEIKRLFDSVLGDKDIENHEENKRTKTPSFLVQMRKRQQERAEKREEIKKYHELKAAEKQRQAYENETLRIQKEQEEKLKRRRKIRQLIKAEKEGEMQRKTELERLQFQNQKAKINNEKRLKKRFGFEPWKQLLQEKRINEYWAEKHHDNCLQKRCLQDWIHWTKSNQIMRRVKAEEFERQRLLTNSLGKWVEVKDFRIFIKIRPKSA